MEGVWNGLSSLLGEQSQLHRMSKCIGGQNRIEHRVARVVCVESVLRNFRTGNSIGFSVDISLAAGGPTPPI